MNLPCAYIFRNQQVSEFAGEVVWRLDEVCSNNSLLQVFVLWNSIDTHAIFCTNICGHFNAKWHITVSTYRKGSIFYVGSWLTNLVFRSFPYWKECMSVQSV